MMSRLNECCRDTRTKCKKFLSAGAYADSKLLLDFDFTDGIVFGGVHLIPETLQTGQRAERIPYSPALVVQTKGRIINGHTRIFGAEFRAFLKKYVTYIEDMRLLLWSRRP